MKRDLLVTKITELGTTVFSIQNLRMLFPEEANMKVTVRRLKKKGVIVPVTRGWYRLKGVNVDVEKLATQLYYPSYISFESALSKYGIINQGLYKLTLATTRHSKKIALEGLECEYIQIKPDLFFGYSLTGSTYIAEAEKAILDEIYLKSLGKRAINWDEWQLNEISQPKLRKYVKLYPKATADMVQKLFKTT